MLYLFKKIQKKCIKIDSALNKLDSIKYIHPRDIKERSGFQELYGYIETEDYGFNKLVRIIQNNMPELRDSCIVEIDKSSPIVMGGIWSHVINLRYQSDIEKNEFIYHPITTDLEFRRWIRENKRRQLIIFGMILISIGYFVTIGTTIWTILSNKFTKKKILISRKSILRKHL